MPEIMAHETTRPSLLSRVRNLSDHAAWREFDEKYRDLILRYCQRKGLQRTDAEDVRQMVMLNLARQLRTFSYQPERGRFRDYMGRVVQNAIHRFFRRPRPENRGLDTDVVAGLDDESEERERDAAWEAEWMLHHYRMAMAAVRETAEPKSVQVFERLLSGDSTDEVAAAMGMKRDAVHKVKQRMRDRLKELVAQQVLDEDAAEGGA
jgi:RNA polymerase sigma-70 factor (ECF subfamily)